LLRGFYLKSFDKIININLDFFIFFIFKLSLIKNINNKIIKNKPKNNNYNIKIIYPKPLEKNNNNSKKIYHIKKKYGNKNPI
jgi:hypothetical protein